MSRLDINRIRKERQLTQKQLAQLTSYPQGFISQIENGKAKCPLAFIEKVRDIFGITDIENYIIDEQPEPDGADKDNKAEEQVATSAPVQEASADSMATQSPDQFITMSFLTMLQRKEKRIEELEAENRELRMKLNELLVEKK